MKSIQIALIFFNMVGAALNVSSGSYGLATLCALAFFLLLLDFLAEGIRERLGGGR